MLDGHLVKENGKHTLLHLTGVFGTQDDHFLFGKVYGDGGARRHTFCVTICRERASIVDGVIWLEVLQLFRRRPDQHVAHEQSMVGTGTDNADVDAVTLVPAGVAIDDIETAAGV